MDKADDFIVHKCRVEQARHFLGDNFASAFDNYLKSIAPQTWSGGDIVSIVDSVPFAKEITDSTTHVGVETGLLVQGTLLGWLPGNVGTTLETIILGKNFLKGTRMLGEVLLFYIFSPGFLVIIAKAIVRYLITHPVQTRALFSEIFHVLKVFRKGSICIAATALVDPQIPAYILEDLVQETKLNLLACNWPATAIKQMTGKIKMPEFLDYYSILIRHFPQHLSGPSSVVTSGLGWIFRRPSDLVIRLADVVGLFHRKDYDTAVSKLAQSVMAHSQGKESVFDESIYITLDYYLAHMRIPEQIRSNRSDIPDLERRCQLLTSLFIRNEKCIKYIVSAGFYNLTALVAAYPPLGSTNTASLQGRELLIYAVNFGTALTMLAALQHTRWPSSEALENFRPKIDKKDDASLAKYLVFQAYLSPQRKSTVMPCRHTLYPKLGGFSFTVGTPIDFSFIPNEMLLKPNEVRAIAIATSNIVFGVPIHIALETALETESACITVVATVNEILRARCGLINEPLYVAVRSDRAVELDTPRRPLKVKRNELKSRSSNLNYK
jgi:hypothetical protein